MIFYTSEEITIPFRPLQRLDVMTTKLRPRLPHTVTNHGITLPLKITIVIFYLFQRIKISLLHLIALVK